MDTSRLDKLLAFIQNEPNDEFLKYALATEYLRYLYSKEGQTIAAKNFYRPRDAEVAKTFSKNFPSLKFFTIDEFGGWSKAQPEHFGDGGIFDKIYSK